MLHNEPGIVTKAKNADQIAEAIKFFLQNPDKIDEYGKNGKSFLENELSWNSIARKVEKIYSQEMV